MQSHGSEASCTSEPETEYWEENEAYEVERLIVRKLEEDVLECADWISEEANTFFQQRVLSFERLRCLLALYDLPIQLYGSCACGIAVKNSDVDIAVDEKILSQFQPFLPHARDQMEAALDFLTDLFKRLVWITFIEPIKSARVPVIKLVIDTNTPVLEDFFSLQDRMYLSRKIPNGGKVSIDLTIETKKSDFSSNHLGVTSTQEIRKWLQEIPTLNSLVVILKYYLIKRSLNDTYSKGLNNYGLIVLIVAYIDHAGMNNEERVSVVLDGLLNFYGWEFQEKLYKVDIRQKEVFIRKEKETCFADLEICDPINHGNIMTKKCYNFDKIKLLMRDIYTDCIMRTRN